ncbi:non-canonical purine NTP pyrophosphatase [Candidatus Aenigmatarchaeota archaeon]
MEISVVTSNRNKFDEISLVLVEYGITAIKVDKELDEIGNTLEERLLSKARHAYSLVKKPLIVDDTGVFFSALDNFPGPFAKKYFKELGYDGLLKKINGKSRRAYFKTLVCYIDGETEKTFEGVHHGRITDNVRDIVDDRPQFPYEKIFISEGSDKTMSELTLKQKIEFSHRAIAVRKFCEFFVKK